MKSKAIFPLLISTLLGLLLLSVLFFFGLKEQQQLTTQQLNNAIEEQIFRTRLISDNIKSRIKETSSSSQRLAQYIKNHFKQVSVSTPFFNTIEQLSDNSIRSKITSINTGEATVFLPAGHSIDYDMQRLISRIKVLIDGYGKGALHGPFANTWFMTNEGGIVIQWPNLPDFVRQARADFSYINTPWLPSYLYEEKKADTYWTPLSLDPIPNTWMTSSVTPIYNDNQLLGSVGHDITLNELIDSTKLIKDKFNANFAIIDEKDRIIATDIFESKNKFEHSNLTIKDIKNKNWLKILQQHKENKNKGNILTRDISGSFYTITYIEDSGWYFITSTPTEEITKNIESAFVNLEFITFISIIIEIIIIAIIFTVSRNKLYTYIDSLKKSHRTIKDEKERYQNLVDNSSNIVYQCRNDDNWTMIYLNGAVEQIMGYQKEEFLRKKRYFSELVHHDDIEYVRKKVTESIKDNQQFELIFRFITKDKSVRWVLERGSRQFSSTGEEYLEGVIIDISELKRVELELQELNATLDERVDNKTRELKQTVEQLESAQERLIESEKLSALGGLVAGIAHEVNTPLGISITASSIISERLNSLKTAFENQSLTSKQFLDQLTLIFESCGMLDNNLDRATRLINSFKQTAVDQSSDDYCLFNLSQTLEALLTSLHHETKKIPVEPVLVCDKDLSIRSYPGVLVQVISNLILNSTRHAFHNHPTPQITIRITKHNKRIEIDYTDNGIGVPDKLHKKIFEPFYTTKRGQGGSGLGLNLVFNMVSKKLHGELLFNSEPNKGVHFSISLPLSVNNASE